MIWTVTDPEGNFPRMLPSSNRYYSHICRFYVCDTHHIYIHYIITYAYKYRHIYIFIHYTYKHTQNHTHMSVHNLMDNLFVLRHILRFSVCLYNAKDNPLLYIKSKGVNLRCRKGQSKVNCISWHFIERMSSLHSRSLKEQLALLAENYRAVKKQSIYQQKREKLYFKCN